MTTEIISKGQFTQHDYVNTSYVRSLQGDNAEAAQCQQTNLVIHVTRAISLIAENQNWLVNNTNITSL